MQSLQCSACISPLKQKETQRTKQSTEEHGKCSRYSVAIAVPPLKVIPWECSRYSVAIACATFKPDTLGTTIATV